MATVIGIAIFPFAKIQDSTGSDRFPAQELFRVALVVFLLFGIGHKHGIRECLEKIVHGHFPHHGLDLQSQGGIIQHTLGLGLLENDFLVDPMVQKR